MTVCTACGNNAPDDMRHCSQCGARLPEPEPEAPGKTGHFGDQDIKDLMSKMERERSAPTEDGNLLAGLPRPKVGSMLSPLRGGQTSAAARKPEKRARSASGSTVMGMPLFSTGEQRAVPMPRPRARPSTTDESTHDVGAPLDGGPSIQSLDSFKDDVNAPQMDQGDRAAADRPSAADRHDGPAPVESDRASGPADRQLTPAVDPGAPGRVEELPHLPGPDALDITSRDRPTERAPAVSAGSGLNPVVAVVIAAAIAAVAFFLLK